MYFVRFVLFCTDAVNDFLNKNCPYIAGAISFYTLFSLFPLFLVVVLFLGWVLPDADRLELARNIADIIPVSTEVVSQTVESMADNSALTGIFVILGLIWASTAAFAAMRKGINAAWGINRTRPYLKERLMDISLVLGAGVILIVVLATGPALGILTEINSAMALEADLAGDLLLDLLAQLLSPLLSFATFLLLYRYLPNTEIRFRDVWLGALFASIAFDGANWGFVWYVSTNLVDYNVVYGSVGAVLALLTWVYVSAIIVLFGALVTSRYAACASTRRTDEQGLKILWTGLSRVRLRVVDPSAAG